MKCYLFSFLFISTLSFGQVKTEKYFYNKEFLYFMDRPEVDSALATYIDYHIYFDTLENNGIIRTLNLDGRICYEGEYSNIQTRIRNGFSKEFYNNGQLKSSAYYINNELDGELTSYYPSGQLKRKDYFKKGKFKKGNCYSITGQDTVHFDFEKMPQFPGGAKEMFRYIGSNVRYPLWAKENGVEGTVVAQFMIDQDGQLEKIKIVRHVQALLDAEILRVIKSMPKWSPGIVEGIAVPVLFTMPFRFKLEE